MMKYDLAIIGSGPGGYVAAIYASRRKLKTCVIEKDLVGGTCLNKGCIPTKSLLNSASIVSLIKGSSVHGIDVKDYTIDFAKMIARKDEVVLRLRAGIETLFRGNAVILIKGTAVISGPNTLKINGTEEISAKNIIIASGSVPAELPNIKFDGRDVLSSDDILNLRAIPASLAIIGGGVIGCEFAGLYNVLGSKVTVIEFTDRLVPTQSREISKKLELSLKRRGIDILTSTCAEAVVKRGAGLMISLSGRRSLETEKILVSVGRAPVTGHFSDLEALGIGTKKGKIIVDDYLRTEQKNIYAIGDCVDGPLLAHKASYDGIMAVDNILGKMKKSDYSNVPSCIWTEPQIASVGICEEEARAKNIEIKISKFPYLGSGKAYLLGKPEGYAKIISDRAGKILGIEVFGEGACDLIAEAVLAKTANVDVEAWSRVVHGHPTLSEIWQEAAHAFCGTPIHGL
ncbi:MAG: dihydrolipoyl dehydrogenase [Candidatus Omnitrophica bacterium]|nr:dihydrolipoyl dehydrogenase [Candidatus Omnitrophota bacterium]